MADVTIVITAFNRERYIAEALESALAQTVCDLEVLVVDDNSQDATVAVAERIARRDARVRVVRNERNLGDYPNRNRAARLVQTPFFKYHDSDDVMYPHCIEVMLTPLRNAPSAGFALSGSRSWSGAPCPMLLTPRECYQREFLGTGMFHLGPAAALFRTDVFHRLGGFRDGGIASDAVYWLAACREVSVLLVPGDLFYWREHEGQEYRRVANARDQARARGVAWRALADPRCPLSESERELARRNFAYSTASAAYHHLRAGQGEHARLVLRHAGLTATDWIRYFRRPRRSAQAGTPASEARSAHS